MKKLILIIFPLILLGCSSLQLGSEGDVSTNPGDGAHLDTKLTMADYTSFAEKVTDKMLRSKLVQSWGSKKPRLVVSKLLNNTDDESIEMSDIYDRISATILKSGLVRIVGQTATSFDYIVRSELSSTRQYGKDGEELAYYKLEFKLFKISGQMVGQWSDVLALGKAKRRFI